jgi:hypothetical protein
MSRTDPKYTPRILPDKVKAEAAAKAAQQLREDLQKK